MYLVPCKLLMSQLEQKPGGYVGAAIVQVRVNAGNCSRPGRLCQLESVGRQQSYLDDGVIMRERVKIVVENGLPDDVERQPAEEVLHLDRAPGSHRLLQGLRIADGY